MKARFKLVFVTQSFGGVFTYIKQIIESIDLDEFEFTIIAPQNKALEAVCSQYSVEYIVLEMARGFNPFLDFKNIFQLKRILSRLQPDLVHLHSSKAGFIGRIAASKAKVKNTFTPHGLSYLSFTGYKRLFFIFLEVFAKKYTKNILACSNSEALRMQYEIGVSSDKIVAIPNSTQITKIINKTTKRIFDRNTSNIKVGLIARLTYQKNPLLFVEVAKEVMDLFPNASFSILGAGLHDHLIQETNDLIERLGISKSFEILDWGNSDTSDSYLQSLDIFMMPSIFEGLPFSLLEAMDKGVLCITSKCDGCNDVMQNNYNGFSCITKQEYVQSIKYLIENPTEQSRIRENAYKRMESEFDIENFIKKLQLYYKTFK